MASLRDQISDVVAGWLGSMSALDADERARRLAEAIWVLESMATCLERLIPAEDFGADPTVPTDEPPRIDLGLTLDHPLPMAEGWPGSPDWPLLPDGGVDAYVGDAFRLANLRDFGASMARRLADIRRGYADLDQYLDEVEVPLMLCALEQAQGLDDPLEAETWVAVNQRATIAAEILAGTLEP
jgi:hypothetical protein